MVRQPKDGRDGRDGKDADPALIRRLVDKAAADAVAGLPPPKDGRDGQDGKDVDPAALTALVDEFVTRAETLRPIPKDGARGPRGPRGEKGEQGEQGDPGPKPKHEWDGSRLRFERPSGKWGDWADLRGPQGFSGGGSVSTTSGNGWFPGGW